MSLASPAAKRLLLGLLAGAVGFAAALGVWLAGWHEGWEGKTWDWRVKVLAKGGRASESVVLILLDQESLDWGRRENSLSWPWPREVYGVIVDFCRRHQARAVVFDVLFTEPSAYGVADDRAFARAIRQGPPFVGVAFLSHKAGSQRAWPDEAPAQRLNVAGLSPLDRKGEDAPFGTFPIMEVAAASSIIADTQLAPDPDGVYRRIKPWSLFAGRVVPSPALAAFLAAAPETRLSLSGNELSVGRHRVPLDEKARAILNFRGPSGTHRAYSAAAVLASELRLRANEEPPIKGEALFKDRYVLVGYSAPGLFDLRPTPVAGVYPGVEIHATALDNLLSDDFIRPVPGHFAPLLAFLFTFAGGLTTAFITGTALTLAAYAVFLVLPVLAALAAYAAGLWLPLVVPQLGVTGTLVAAGLLYYTSEGRQKLFLKNAFKQYLSPAVIEELIRHPERLKLGGERRVISVFFSDLEGFTAISEGLEPEGLTALLNEYLSAMTDVIQEEGGTVDKYEGDAIIAFWNAPLPQEDHARRCVQAALRCQERLKEINPSLRRYAGRDLRMRIGINSGPAVVGNMGSRTRFDYTILGDAVNLASRLEGINKLFGTRILLSQATADLLGGVFPMRRIGQVAVVGRRKPVTVYEPLPDGEAKERAADLEVFGRGLAAFGQGRFAEAEGLFAGISGRDPAARAYVEKCRLLQADPPAAWDGTWTAETK